MTHQDDIAYIRALAQEGRHAPLLSGPVLVAASLTGGSASALQWAIQTGIIDITPWAQLWVWLGAGGLFAAVMAAIMGRMKRKPGFNSVANTAVGAAWSGIGFLIFSVWLAMVVTGLKTGDWSAMQIMPSLVFAAYGAAWMVASVMSGQKWLGAVSLGSYAGAVLLGVVSGETSMYLVFVGLLVVLALIPGLALMRREPVEAA